MEDILVPLGFFALIFGAFYLKYRRDMAMIERGMDPRTPWMRGRRALREQAYGGMPPAGMPSDDTVLELSEYRAVRMERALTLTGVGLALTIGMSFMGFGPWLLGGLIPLFLGLSRLLSILIIQEKAPLPPTSSTTVAHSDRSEGQA